MALNRVYREGFTENVTLGERYKGGKKSKPCSYLGAGISGKEYEHSQYVRRRGLCVWRSLSEERKESGRIREY